MIGAFVRDLRFAARRLRRKPGFTAVVILTLALGIGTSTAVYTVANTILIRPLPFPAPERLVVLQSTSRTAEAPFTVAPGVFHDWRERATSFESVGGAEPRGATVSITGDEPQSHPIARATAAFLPMLGVSPIVGRLFTLDDEQSASTDVILVEEAFWRRECGARLDIIGQRIRVDNLSPTIVGVVRSGFRFRGVVPDLWVPMAPRPTARTGGSVIVIARLKPGVARERAQAEMEVVQQQIGREHREDSRVGIVVTPLHDWVVRSGRRGLVLLSSAVGVLLLICCANIAGLLLAQMTGRQKEYAVRASLGSGRLRLAAEPLAECLVIAVAGGVLGWWLAAILVDLVPSIEAIAIPRVEEIQIDRRMLAIATAVTALTTLSFGFVPAVQASRSDVRAALQTGGGAGTSTPGAARLRNALVVGQVALAVVLLAGAGLLTKTLYNLITTDLRFNRSRMVSMQVGLPGRSESARDRVLHDELLGRVRGLREVQAATTADQPPLAAVLYPYQLRPTGSSRSHAVETLARHVGPDYLAVLGVSLLSGRDLQQTDAQRVPTPVLLNKAAATALFGTESVLGRTLEHNYRQRPPLEVVGIADDVRQLGVRRAAGPQVYIPSAFSYSRHTYVLARIVPGVTTPTQALRVAARTLGAQVSVSEVIAVNEVFEREVAEPRFYAVLLNAIALFAVVLAALGIYGLASYNVARRTKEFGVRMALGAHSRQILRLAMNSGATLTAFGVVLGMLGALATTRIVAHLLYGVDPRDPGTLAAISGLLASVALAASWLPARRATRIDPVVTLRTE